jgi:hypothetical protein
LRKGRGESLSEREREEGYLVINQTPFFIFVCWLSEEDIRERGDCVCESGRGKEEKRER